LRGQLPTARYSLLRRLLEDVDEVVRTATIGDGDETVEERFIQKLEEALQVLRIPEFLELEDLVARHALENLGMDATADRDRFNLSFGLRRGSALPFLEQIRATHAVRDSIIVSGEVGVNRRDWPLPPSALPHVWRTRSPVFVAERAY
jgi:hypothetical protein